MGFPAFVHPRVPGPPFWEMWRTLKEIRRDRLAFTLRLTREYGDLVQFCMGSKQNLLVNDPRLIREILVEHPERYRKGLGLQHARALFGNGLLTSEGDIWRMQRRITARAFGHEAIEGLVAPMAQVIDEELSTWSAAAQQGQPVGLRRALSRLTLRVLGRVLLGQELGPQSEVLTDGVTAALDHAMKSMSRFLDSPFRSAPRALYDYRQSIRNFHSCIDRIIDDLRKNASPEAAPLQGFLSDRRSDECDADTLHDEVATLLIVGHETTACAATWAFLLMALHPSTEVNVRAELNETRCPGIAGAGLASLRYTRALVEETLRLYPPVWLIPREALVDHELDGVHIHRKTGVLVSPYALHRHPALWPEPEVFRPERFLDRKSSCHAVGGYVPFGLGPRACLGATFAMTELLLVVGLTLRRYRLHFAEGTRAIVPEALLTLRPGGETNVFLEEMSSSARSPGSVSTRLA